MVFGNAASIEGSANRSMRIPYPEIWSLPAKVGESVSNIMFSSMLVACVSVAMGMLGRRAEVSTD